MRGRWTVLRGMGPGASFSERSAGLRGPRTSFQRGFGLIEVSISIAIMTGVLLLFMGTEVTMVRARAQAGRRWDAVRTAGNRIERLRGLGFDRAVGSSGSEQAREGVECSWRVVRTGSLSDLARIEVVCEWSGRLKENEIQMVSLLAK